MSRRLLLVLEGRTLEASRGAGESRMLTTVLMMAHTRTGGREDMEARERALSMK